MDVRYLKKLIKIVEESEISELEIEDQGSRVKIVKHSPHPHSSAMVHLAHSAPPAAQPAPAAAAAAAQELKDSKLVEVASPMVGTFYRAPSPGAPVFVEVGDRVKLGQTLCILEAMKLMNELECEVAGVVREICVEDGQPVEYGTRLFLIDPEG
ncbi:acetyl-CoA carboxylase biotin carboxyl carrier protein [Gemmatimonadota bacterium]